MTHISSEDRTWRDKLRCTDRRVRNVCMGVWQDRLMLWVAQHYHISPAGESTCCCELLNVWLRERLNYMGKE
jgi:hypothetical protein